MKIKTRELSGTDLDYAVAKAVGKAVTLVDGSLRDGDSVWSPTLNWSDTGPLIQKHGMQLSGVDSAWCAELYWAFKAPGDEHKSYHHAKGRTALEAVCRCLASALLGAEIEVDLTWKEDPLPLEGLSDVEISILKDKGLA